MPVLKVYGDTARAMELATGINTITGDKLAQAIDFGPSNVDLTTTPSGGLLTDYTLNRIDSFSDVRKRLEINASASFGFGIFSTDIAYHNLEQASIHDFSTFVLIRMKLLAPPQTIKPNVIKLSASALADYNAGVDQFIAKYGNVFAASVTKGGELAVLMELTSSSSAQQAQARTSADAAVAGFGSGQLLITQAIQQIASTASVSLHVIRNGTNQPIPDSNSLVQAAQHFPEQIANPAAQVVMEVGLQSYGTAINLPSPFPSGIQLSAREDDMDMLADLMDEAKQRRSELRYASLHPEEFSDYAQPQFADRFAAVQSVIQGYLSTAGDIAAARPYTVSPQLLPAAFSRLVPAAVDTGWVTLDPTGARVLGVVKRGQQCSVTFKGRWAAGGQQPSFSNPYCGAVGLTAAQTSDQPLLAGVFRPSSQIGLFCVVIELWEFGHNSPSEVHRGMDPGVLDSSGRYSFTAAADYEVRISMNDFPGLFGDNILDPSDPMQAWLIAK